MKTAHVILGTVLICGAAMPSFPAVAQTQPIPEAQTIDFVHKVAGSDMLEIAISRLAQDRGTQADKAFAATMIEDHTKTSEELKALVAKMANGISMPSALPKKDQKILDSLARLTGPKFGARFDAVQVRAHEAAITLFGNYARNGDNPDLKAWAAKTLPTLKHHLDMARQLAKH